jgi:hypothetical protein
MDKTVAGLLGAVTALAVTPSQAAAPTPLGADAAMHAHSYADLLKPIPNALALLKASATAEARASVGAPAPEGEATLQDVQYHHHHHHHHRFFRRRFYHHHHHDSSYRNGYGGYGNGYVGAPPPYSR